MVLGVQGTLLTTPKYHIFTVVQAGFGMKWSEKKPQRQGFISFGFQVLPVVYFVS